jgi:hypothetical protein
VASSGTFDHLALDHVEQIDRANRLQEQARVGWRD